MAAKLNFENGVAELENIVNQLESGSISLEDSFKAYKKGVELYKALRHILDEGDAKITELTADGEREFPAETAE